jgi:hypothetical protein
MADLDLAKVNSLFPKILEKTVRNQRYQSRFLKQINEAAEKIAYNNPLGSNTPYVTSENATLFGVSEGGQILNGAPVEYTQAQIDIRKMWKSAGFTGDVERQLDSKTAEIASQKPELRGNFEALNQMAHNRLVRDLVFSTLNLYAHHENYFALQGTDKSTVGVVTELPGTLGAGNVGFAWATTSQGNRIFEKNQRIQFYDSAAPTQRTTAMVADAGSYFSTVDLKPDHRASTNAATGTTHFDNLPSTLAVGDTAHFQNSYGSFPQGFVHYVDDTGNFKNIARSTDYERFASVMDRRTGSPNLTPLILHENESFLEGKVGYDMPFVCKIVMNKTQRFVYTSQLYNTQSGFAYTRFIETQKNGGRIDKYDPSVNTKEEALAFGNKEIIIDEHVPPGEVFFINFASWRKYVRTEVKPYAFDSGSYIINPIDQYGVRLDKRMFTIFSEYNWDCMNPITNSRITGLAFPPAHVRQP